MSENYFVTGIEAVVGGGSTFALRKDTAERLVLTSTSVVVQAAMLGAYLTGGEVAPEQETDTSVIRRVPAFERGAGIYEYQPGKYQVSRIATQRDGNGTGVDHLEAFLLDEQQQEKAYNIYDPLLGQLIMAAFSFRGSPPQDYLPLYIGTYNVNLVSVRLGERANPGPGSP